MSSQERVIDTELALERAGGNAKLAAELFKMLQNELPVYEVKIRSLFDTGDLPALTETVHKLHGAAVYCGVPALKAAAEALETDLKRDERSRFESGVQQTLSAINELMKTPELPL